MNSTLMTTCRPPFACRAASAALLVTLISGVAGATAVTDFRTYRSGTANGTAPALSGSGNDPVVGDLAGNPTSPGIVLGYLSTPAVLGANAGDKVTMSFTVHFNDAVGLTPSGDNFRWALFDLNGESPDSATGGLSGGPTYATAGTANTDQFRGFWLGNFGGGGAGNAGSIRQRLADLDASTDNPFTNTAANPAVDIGTVSGDTVPLVSDVNGDGAGFDYTGTLTLTRAAGGLIDVSGTFVGTNIGVGETDNIFTSDASVSASSNYGAVGFLVGGPLNVDQLLFTDIDVAVTPAGAALASDFNHDNAVNGADLEVWKTAYGSTAAADANNDGASDGADFLIWQQNVGAGPGVSAVPEPCCALLAAVGCLAAAARRKERITN
jgi:hypothetical protein